MADGQDTKPGHEGVVEEIGRALVEPKNAEKDLQADVSGDGMAHVSPRVEKAEGAGEGYLAGDVEGDVGEEGGEIQRGVGGGMPG